MEFSAASYNVQEDCTNVPVIVTRSGDLSGATTVEFLTTDDSASQRTDYSLGIGRLAFAPSETSKTIHLLISEDSKVEGTETFSIGLMNVTGGTLGDPSTATVQIMDDVPESTGNALDSNAVFVCQHYHDFLNREPEPPGLAAWVNILNTCPSGDTSCDRIEVSSAFFRSEEFQDRGYFVYRLYATALGRVPLFNEFMMDLSRVTGFLTPQQLEVNKVLYIQEFMLRPEFFTRYNFLTNSAYVNELEQTAGVTLANKQALIDDLEAGRKTRAQVLREISQGPEVTAKFFREAFVIEAYFGYLRRDADILYLNWIQTFNQTNDYRVIVNGFLNSAEYRNRFGP